MSAFMHVHSRGIKSQRLLRFTASLFNCVFSTCTESYIIRNVISLNISPQKKEGAFEGKVINLSSYSQSLFLEKMEISRNPFSRAVALVICPRPVAVVLIKAYSSSVGPLGLTEQSFQLTSNVATD